MNATYTQGGWKVYQSTQEQGPQWDTYNVSVLALE